METSRLDRIEKAIANLAEADEKRVEEDRKRAEEDRKRAEEDRKRAEEFRKERAEEDMKRAEEDRKRAEEDRKERAEEFRREMKERREADEKRAEEFRREMKERKETDEKRAEEFNREMKERKEADEKRAEEFRREMKERDKRFEKYAEKIDKVGKLLGSMGISQGDYAEELFYRSFEDNPVLGGVEFDEVDRRVQIRGNKTDYDVVLKNGDSVGIVEVKYKAHPDDVEAIAEKKIKEFRRDFPDGENRKIYFGIASLSTNPELERKAREKGIFLLTQKGDRVEVVNDEVRTF